MKLVLATIITSALLFFNQALMSEALPSPKIVIHINEQAPSESYGIINTTPEPIRFLIGTGRNGILAEGERFQDGYSLLGDFKVTGILSNDRFEMLPEAINMSPKPVEYLKENLFTSMSAIDFDGDGNAAEYGSAYIALTPLSTTEQPFNFGEFKNQYRWYNYAIHGTNDENRIGKKSTGGCINVGQETLKQILAVVKLGELVRVVNVAN